MGSDLVLFVGVPDAYYIEDDISIEFVFKPEAKGSTRDWIGIYEMGWKCFEKPLAFEWGLGLPLDWPTRKRRMTFKNILLMNAQEDKMYQFVYVSKYLDILGKSSYFKFIRRPSSSGTRQQKFKNINPSEPNSYTEQSEACKSEKNSRGRECNQQKVQNQSPAEEDQYVMLPDVNETILEFPIRSPVKNHMKLKTTVPKCHFKTSKEWDKIYTSCSECELLHNLLESQNKAITKFDENSELYKGLHCRLGNVEYILSLICPDVPNEMSLNRICQISECSNIVKDILNELNEDYSGGHPILHKEVNESKTKILTHGEDTVYVLRAEEKMIPEVCSLSSVSSEEIN